MKTTRLEAFSDGVIAIIITIMVLELKVPHSGELSALEGLIPVFLAYLLSFLMLGIYWNNHHHLIHVTKEVTSGIMWANLHLLFWLSLVPFVTAWMGEHHTDAVPTMLFGADMLMAGVAYNILQNLIVSCHGADSKLAASIGRDIKGKISVGSYVLAIILALYSPAAAQVVYLLVAIMWVVPDRRTKAAHAG